ARRPARRDGRRRRQGAAEIRHHLARPGPGGGNRHRPRARRPRDREPARRAVGRRSGARGDAGGGKEIAAYFLSSVSAPPAAISLSISAAEKPRSASTARVSTPNLRGLLRTAGGVRDSLIGLPTLR